MDENTKCNLVGTSTNNTPLKMDCDDNNVPCHNGVYSVKEICAMETINCRMEMVKGHWEKEWFGDFVTPKGLMKVHRRDDGVAINSAPINLPGDNIPRSFTYMYKGMYHRDDGPAVIYDNVKFTWFQYNKNHRVSGPPLSIMEMKNCTLTGVIIEKTAMR